MEKTFVLRRKEISEGLGAVHDILAAYEALKYPEEVLPVVFFWYLYIVDHSCTPLILFFHIMFHADILFNAHHNF